jgi:transposase
VRCLQDLQGDRIRILGRLEGIQDEAVRTFWRENLRFIDDRITAMRQDLDVLCKSSPELARRCELLASIPGIGQRTALQMLAEIPDVNAFTSAKQLAAYAGLTPANRTSGISVRGRSMLSKRGNPAIRKALYLPALSALRYNPAVQALAKRLTERGKPKMAVIGAAMRKLLHIIYGVLKSETSFRMVPA